MCPGRASGTQMLLRILVGSRFLSSTSKDLAQTFASWRGGAPQAPDDENDERDVERAVVDEQRLRSDPAHHPAAVVGPTIAPMV